MAAVKLHRPAARRAAGRFLVEGAGAVRDALDAGAVRELYCAEDAGERIERVILDAADRGVLAHRVSARAVAALSDTRTPQGVVAVCATLDVPVRSALAGGPRLVAVPVDVSDPGNAGTVVRVADAAGADAVILAGDSVDPHNGKCVRSSAGSVFHLPIARVRSTGDLIPTLRSAGLQVLATSADGELDLDDADATLRRPTAWLFGNEAHGLRPELAATADHRIRIPIHGRAESLNLATAAAVCLYASARVRHHF